MLRRSLFAAAVTFFCTSGMAIADFVPDPSLDGQWCFWLYLVSEQGAAHACHLPHAAIDDLVDSGLARIEAFIVSKSAHPPVTPAEIADLRESQESQSAEIIKTHALDVPCKDLGPGGSFGQRLLPLSVLRQEIDDLTTHLTGRMSCD
jgi:hypothetical protein